MRGRRGVSDERSPGAHVQRSCRSAPIAWGVLTRGDTEAASATVDGHHPHGEERGVGVVRNMIWLLLSQVTSWAASILILIAAPRFLGDTNYGTLQFAVVFVSFFMLLATLGSDTYIVKMTARDQ